MLIHASRKKYRGPSTIKLQLTGKSRLTVEFYPITALRAPLRLQSKCTYVNHFSHIQEVYLTIREAY